MSDGIGANATPAGPSLSARFPGSPSRTLTGTRARLRPAVVAYWVFTLVVVYENLAGFVWWVAKLPLAPELVTALGYPLYFLDILAPWQLAAALVLIAPGLPIAKEWAYAGALFNYSGAIASHLFAGKGPVVVVVAAVVYLVCTVASWALRPPGRRVSTPWIGETRASSWIGAFVILALMLIGSLLSLPLIASVGRTILAQ
jgi:hypothetical protein